MVNTMKLITIQSFYVAAALLPAGVIARGHTAPNFLRLNR